jgi:uncharacterized membrane protein
VNIPARKSYGLDFLTFAILLGTAALTAAVYDRLPDPMPAHFDFRGRVDAWTSRPAGAWLLPAFSVGLVVLLRFGSRLMPPEWRERLEASPVRALALAVAAVLSGVQVLVLRASLDTFPHLGAAIWVLLGALFVVIGLLLPRTRRNPFFGVRTAYALSSDENWARTQRAGGYWMTIGGIVVSAAGLLGSPGAALATLIVSSLAPAVWSWIIARRSGAADGAP